VLCTWVDKFSVSCNKEEVLCEMEARMLLKVFVRMKNTEVSFLLTNCKGKF
jgi:hypothetical protein